MSNNFLWRNGFLKVLNEVKKMFSFKTTNNVEYKSEASFNGKPVYYQYISKNNIRISTSAQTLISNIDTLLYQTLSFSATTGGNVYYLPYSHTNNVGVILLRIGNDLKIQSQNSDFAGNYNLSGLIAYTKR